MGLKTEDHHGLRYYGRWYYRQVDGRVRRLRASSAEFDMGVTDFVGNGRFYTESDGVYGSRDCLVDANGEEFADTFEFETRESESM